jgi:hypothetical protein
MTNAQEKNHALDNAASWMQSISAMVSALDVDFDRLESLQTDKDNGMLASEDEDEYNGLKQSANEFTSEEEASERIQESPLCVQVREGWKNPGEESEPEEFSILLTTGGPALRIIGDLGRYGSPESPRLQYQDWGTYWTDFDTTSEQDEDLNTFCQRFYFGE